MLQTPEAPYYRASFLEPWLPRRPSVELTAHKAAAKGSQVHSQGWACVACGPACGCSGSPPCRLACHTPPTRLGRPDPALPAERGEDELRSLAGRGDCTHHLNSFGNSWSSLKDPRDASATAGMPPPQRPSVGAAMHPSIPGRCARAQSPNQRARAAVTLGGRRAYDLTLERYSRDKDSC